MTHRGPFQPLLFCDSVILSRSLGDSFTRGHQVNAQRGAVGGVPVCSEVRAEPGCLGLPRRGSRSRLPGGGCDPQLLILALEYNPRLRSVLSWGRKKDQQESVGYGRREVLHPLVPANGTDSALLPGKRFWFLVGLWL